MTESPIRSLTLVTLLLGLVMALPALGECTHTQQISFAKLDRDRDGVLSEQDLRLTLESLRRAIDRYAGPDGVVRGLIVAAIGDLDVDGDRMLTENDYRILNEVAEPLRTGRALPNRCLIAQLRGYELLDRRRSEARVSERIFNAVAALYQSIQILQTPLYPLQIDTPALDLNRNGQVDSDDYRNLLRAYDASRL